MIIKIVSYIAVTIIAFAALLLFASQSIFAQGPGACGNYSSSFFKNQNPQPQDGNGSLGQIYNNAACGLNYVQASNLVETRSQQYSFNTNGTGLPTTLVLSGLQSNYYIEKAFLWMSCSYLFGSSASPDISITSPDNVTIHYTALDVGTGPSKCWGEAGSRIFRTDVTSSIAGNGDYVVDVSGFVDKNWETDGITLLVIYRDPAASYYGTLVIHDGNTTGNWGNNTQTMTGIVSPCTNSTYADGFVILADMQENVNAGQHQSTINGNSKNYNNDFYNVDLDTTTVYDTQTDALFAADALGLDCFAFFVMALYFQTETCTICGCSAELTVVDDTCNRCTGSAVVNMTGGLPPFTYQWSDNAGDQTSGEAGNLCAGTYYVTVSDQGACEITETVTVKPVSGNCNDLDIPSAFTPNDDGVNDVWMIRGLEGHPECTVEIFNRWGNKLFESTGYSRPWDGTVKGTVLPSAVYYYIIDLGNGVKYTGSVVIVR